MSIRSAREVDAESYLNLGKTIMSEEIYSLTQADELTFTLEQEAQWLNFYDYDEDAPYGLNFLLMLLAYPDLILNKS